MSTLHEECGVFGLRVEGIRHAAACAYQALYALQHRGQESAGIAINDDGVITGRKDVGLVSEVFTPQILEDLGPGDMAVGHVRYATTGDKSRVNAQPLVINHVKGSMALAHNGNLTNAAELREKLELSGAIFHTTSDTEVIAYTITGERLKAPSIEAALSAAMDSLQGAYSLVLMSARKLIAARDPNGFRPLCIGALDGGYVFASESCALDSIGAKFLRDVAPGEIVVAGEDGLRSIRDHSGKAPSSLCVFEFIYFARPDSTIDGSSVHEARLRAGSFLALEHPVQADLVVGVPDSGLDAAIGYARQSGIPYGMGFIKNKYIARTFIAPGQKAREDKVRIKLNPIASAVRGKRVVVVDDSIVRGTTSARIVGLLREAGATEVHMRISAPPFLHPCYFGTDVDSQDNLIARDHSAEEIAALLGADSLGYLSVESAHKLASGCRCGFCDGCFTGRYPIPVPEVREKFRFERRLSQAAIEATKQ